MLFDWGTSMVRSQCLLSDTDTDAGADSEEVSVGGVIRMGEARKICGGC